MRRTLCLIGVVAVITALTGCERRDMAAEIDTMRTDMQRLENEIGRLEFRIYELENPEGALAQPTEPPAQPAATDTMRADDSGLADSLPAGRIDIRPVE